MILNWKQCFETLKELQYKILIAYRDKDMKLVKIHQHELTRSSANAYDVKVNECFAKVNVARSKTGFLQSNQADYLLKVQKRVCLEC